MFLSVRPLAAKPGTLQLWVGIFGANLAPGPLPNPEFKINGIPRPPQGAPAMREIRDRHQGAHGALNWYGVFEFEVSTLVGKAQPHEKLQIETRLSGLSATINAKPLPDTLDNGFTLSLSSCYYLENDSGHALRELEKRLTHTPDLVILAGDQVYLDNPLLENIPDQQPALSQKFGDKYQDNFCPTSPRLPGLYPLLKLAPTACIPDDHELWNNYPFVSGTMSGSLFKATYSLLRTAARELFEDYQLGDPTHKGAHKLDVGPLHLLLADTRFDRTRLPDDPHGLFSQQTENDLLAWKQNLLDRHQSKQLAVGILACGQILFEEMPDPLASAADKNLQQYRQFSLVVDTLKQLAVAGVPVLYLSGDVHFSRVSSATLTATGHSCLYEVVCSPTSQVSGPWRTFKISHPKAPPPGFAKDRFSVHLVSPLIRGDTISTLHFSNAGTGVNVTVTYYSLATPPEPNTTVNFQLTPRF